MLFTTERTFWDATTRSYSVTGRSTRIVTRWGTLHIERPDDGPAQFYWHKPGYGTQPVVTANLRKMRLA